MTSNAAEISEKLKGELIGDPDRLVRGLSPIDQLEIHSITFLGNPKYRKFLDADISRTVLISKTEKVESNPNYTFIRVDNVYAAFSDLSHWWNEADYQPVVNKNLTPISNLARVDLSTSVGENSTIGDFTIVGEGCLIDHDVHIAEQVYIGKGVKIGSGTRIMPGVRIMSKVIIGKNCLIYPNAVIGTDGFGHILGEQGHQKMHHTGTVIIEDNVEIGSSTVIDRGALKDTIIRQGVKLDNLIQVAHGAEIGEGTVIAAQTGISGSSKIGSRSMIGGQVGIVGHVTIADGSKIQAKSGIASDITVPNRKWYGYPILSYLSYLRSYALFKRLPELFERIKSLENQKSP